MSNVLIVLGRGVILAGGKKYIPTIFNLAVTSLGKECVQAPTVGIKGGINYDFYDIIVFIGCSMPVAQLGYNYKELNRKSIWSINVEKPNGLVKCNWIKQDAKEFLRHLCLQ